MWIPSELMSSNVTGGVEPRGHDDIIMGINDGNFKGHNFLLKTHI
jgi:hypothetical protein